MNAINSYIIDIIEGLRMFLFWGGAIALLVGAFSFVIAMWDCESGIKEDIATGRQIRQMIIPELRRQEISRTDLESLLKEIPEGESAVEEFYEFCSANSKAPCIAWCNCDTYWNTASFTNHYLCVAFLIQKRIEEK